MSPLITLKITDVKINTTRFVPFVNFCFNTYLYVVISIIEFENKQLFLKYPRFRISMLNTLDSGKVKNTNPESITKLIVA